MTMPAPNLPGVPKLPTAGLPVPAPGDIAGQISQGNSLNSLVSSQTLGSPPTSSLLSAGLTMASALGNGTITRVATDILGGASAGFAVGGPYGAVAGAVVGALESLLSLGPSYQGIVVIDDTEGIDHLYKVLVQWNSQNIGTGPRSGEPLGWTLWDYLSLVRPPSKTPRPDLLLALIQATAAEQDARWPGKGVGSITGYEMAVWEGTGTGGGFSYFGSASAGGPSMAYLATKGGWTGAQVASATEPLASPVVWLWGQPDQIQDVILNEWYSWATPPDQQGDAGAGAPPPDPSSLKEDALADVVPPAGRTQAQTLQRAIAMAPDPIYWSADLYAQQVADNTTIFNTAALVGLATWLGMSLNGASPRAIATELLLQRGTIAESADGQVPEVFQSLLDDALALARAADEKRGFAGWGSVQSPLLKSLGVAQPTKPASSTSNASARAAAAKTISSFIRRYTGR